MNLKGSNKDHIFEYMLTNTLFSIPFGLSVFLMYIALIFCVIDEYRWGGVLEDRLLYMLQVATDYGIGIVIIPIFAAVPIGSRTTDIISGYRCIGRTTRKRYVSSQIVSSIISGFLVIMIPLLLFIITLLILGYRGVGFGIEGTYEDTVIYFFLMEGNGMLILLMRCVLLSLFGASCAVLVTLLSMFTSNRYILCALPFIIIEIFHFCTNWQCVVFFLNPMVTFLSCTPYINYYPFGGIPNALLYHITWILIFSLIYKTVYKWRFLNG